MDDVALDRIIAKHSARAGPLLPILHDIQVEFGFVPYEAVPAIAEALNLSRAEVHGTISFYHDFRRSPAQTPILKLCRAEACQARGVDRIAAALATQSAVTVEPVYCLGLCASGPAAMIGNRIFARLDEQSALQLARDVAA